MQWTVKILKQNSEFGVEADTKEQARQKALEHFSPENRASVKLRIVPYKDYYKCMGNYD